VIVINVILKHFTQKNKVKYTNYCLWK